MKAIRLALAALLFAALPVLAQVTPTNRPCKMDGSDCSPSTIGLPTGVLTTGTMTPITTASVRRVIHRYDWTNAMVVALGASTTGDITVCTLPAKTVVTNAYVVIKSPDTSTNALTVALGTVAAGYIDFVVASDAKAAANTVYGDVSGERGTNLTGYFLGSFTTTTAVKAHFIKTATFLDTVTGSTGSVYIETVLLP